MNFIYWYIHIDSLSFASFWVFCGFIPYLSLIALIYKIGPAIVDVVLGHYEDPPYWAKVLFWQTVCPCPDCRRIRVFLNQDAR